MRGLRRTLEVLRERTMAVLCGSALWWMVEHLADKAIDHAMRLFLAVALHS